MSERREVYRTNGAPRRVKSIDQNQALIEAALITAGYQVIDTHALGGGFPDLMVVTKERRITVLVEVKQPGAAFTPQEIRFRAWYKGWYLIAHTPEGIIRDLEVLDGV